MKSLKAWHFESAPKLEFNYFTERLHKIGNDKATKAFMNKLRRVYLGEEVLEEFQQVEVPASKQKPAEQNMFEQIDTSSKPFDDYGNFINNKSQGIKQGSAPYFRMMDPPVGARPQGNPSGFALGNL